MTIPFSTSCLSSGFSLGVNTTSPCALTHPQTVPLGWRRNPAWNEGTADNKQLLFQKLLDTFWTTDELHLWRYYGIDKRQNHLWSVGSEAETRNIERLRVPMDARFMINDGQHRRAAFELALKENQSWAIRQSQLCSSWMLVWNALSRCLT